MKTSPKPPFCRRWVTMNRLATSVDMVDKLKKESSGSKKKKRRCGVSRVGSQAGRTEQQKLRPANFVRRVAPRPPHPVRDCSLTAALPSSTPQTPRRYGIPASFLRIMLGTKCPTR
jgi:hypothetical protein